MKYFDVNLPITCAFVCTYIHYNTYKRMQVFEVRPNHIIYIFWFSHFLTSSTGGINGVILEAFEALKWHNLPSQKPSEM